MSPSPAQRTDLPPAGHVTIIVSITDEAGIGLHVNATVPVGLAATMLADQATRMRRTDAASQPAAAATEATKPKVHGVGEADVSEPTNEAMDRRGAGFTA